MAILGTRRIRRNKPNLVLTEDGWLEEVEAESTEERPRDEAGRFLPGDEEE